MTTSGCRWSCPWSRQPPQTVTNIYDKHCNKTARGVIAVWCCFQRKVRAAKFLKELCCIVSLSLRKFLLVWSSRRMTEITSCIIASSWRIIMNRYESLHILASPQPSYSPPPPSKQWPFSIYSNDVTGKLLEIYFCTARSGCCHLEGGKQRETPSASHLHRSSIGGDVRSNSWRSHLSEQLPGRSSRIT